MKHILTLAILTFSISAFAQKSPTSPDYSMAGFEVGFKSNTANVSGATSNKQENGFQLGVSGVYNMGGAFGIKSGLFYTERPVTSESGAVTTKAKITYFEVPLLAMMKFEEYAGVYAGPSIGLKMGDEVSPGALTGVKSMIIPITIGAQFKFLPNLGANVFFENVSGDLATGIANSRAVGVNVIFTLD